MRMYIVNKVKIIHFQIGVCVWPVLQTINFFLVPEHNRVIYVSFCSLIWTSFLSYMKALEQKRREALNDSNTKHKDHQVSLSVEPLVQIEDESKRVPVIQ